MTAGTALCAIGALVVLGVSAQYGVGFYRADRARSQWIERKASLEVAATRRDASAIPALLTADVGAPVAQLVIPRIGLDAIVLEGVQDDQLTAGPGHMPGSPLPGDAGNAIVSAHRDRHFHHLDALQVGDTIVTDSGLERVIWRIVKRRIVDRDAPALFASVRPVLTLTTCWPIRYLGTAPDRLIITAEPISTSAALAHSGGSAVTLPPSAGG